MRALGVEGYGVEFVLGTLEDIEPLGAFSVLVAAAAIIVSAYLVGSGG